MILIPARMQSVRFPNKVLCDIGGVPMVVRTAQNAQRVDEVVVACDDEAIQAVCQKYKIPCVMTSSMHTSGTDRCAEASRKLGLKGDEIVLNIQADEPFLEVEVIETLQNLMKNSGAFMGSLAKVITPEQALDSNLVKVVLGVNKEAIYFSRSVIPFYRDGQAVMQDHPYLGHLGLYGFFASSLQEFCALPKSPLEEIEKLEQLRALYHCKKIALAVVQTQSVGIDTPQDYEYAMKYTLEHKLWQ